MAWVVAIEIVLAMWATGMAVSITARSDLADWPIAVFWLFLAYINIAVAIKVWRTTKDA